MPRVPPARRASVKDVAATAGVSLGTVSNVLNRPTQVSASTRARVEKAMADLGFVRNESARQLRAGTSSSLGYVMLDATNPFFTDVAQGIELAAERAGLSLFICNSDQRPEREAAHLELLQQHRVHGILVTPVDPGSERLDEIPATRHPGRDRRPDPPRPAFCSVAVDDVLGGRLAVEHLVDRGHTRVAFVGGPMELARCATGSRGRARRGPTPACPRATCWWSPPRRSTVANGTTAGERLAGLASTRRPTAAFCANDLLALGLLQQAISAGIAVPSELAIVGYDDIVFATAAAVPLTSVRQPRQRLGRTAAGLLHEELTDPDHRHQQVQFTPDLVARASTLG